MFKANVGEFQLRGKRHSLPLPEVLESRMLLSAPAAFVSKSVANHAVFTDGSSFTQTFKIRNTGTTTWSGYYLVRVSGSDSLGGNANSVAVPTTSVGGTATINLSLQARKGGSNGAAQLGAWELRKGPSSSFAKVMIDGTSGGNLWTSITITPNAFGPGLPRLSSYGYTSTSNPYVQYNYGGQCTAFVWGRANEALNLFLGVSTSAGQSWVNALTGTGKPYKIDQIAKANSIAVWSNGAGGGHVAFVESVSGSNITITEANWNSYRSYASLNDPSGVEWGGGYDGSPKTLTSYDLTHRRDYSFLGYIHLQ